MSQSLSEQFLPKDIQKLYEFYNYHNAAQVLMTGCQSEFKEIIEGLRAFRLTIADIRKPEEMSPIYQSGFQVSCGPKMDGDQN